MSKRIDLQLTPAGLCLMADLLKLASDEFGNHGCNDYELPNTPEMNQLMTAAEKWNSEEEFAECGLNVSDDGKQIYTQDSFLMDFFAALLRQAAEE